MTITRDEYTREWQNRYWAARERGCSTSMATLAADEECLDLLDEIEDEE